MTLNHRNAEAVQGFIQSRVVVTIPGQQAFHLPPVVGVSLAGDIAAMVKTDFARRFATTYARTANLGGLACSYQISNHEK